MQSVVLGVDVAAATVTAATWVAGRGTLLGTFPNTLAGYTQLAAHPALAQAAIHLVLEPTGGYELALAHWALQQGWQVSLPNPKQVRDFGKSRGRRAKTDGQDALLLARFGAETDPAPWHPLPAEVTELESLQRRKDDVEQMLRQEKNRRHALAQRPGQHTAVPRSLERLIEALAQELAELERAITGLLQQHAALRTAVANGAGRGGQDGGAAAGAAVAVAGADGRAGHGKRAGGVCGAGPAAVRTWHERAPGADDLADGGQGGAAQAVHGNVRGRARAESAAGVLPAVGGAGQKEESRPGGGRAQATNLGLEGLPDPDRLRPDQSPADCRNWGLDLNERIYCVPGYAQRSMRLSMHLTQHKGVKDTR